jgi:hypothetical protein
LSILSRNEMFAGWLKLQELIRKTFVALCEGVAVGMEARCE